MTDPQSKIYYVYGLYYPDERIFYVGKGCRDRIYDHVTDARAGKCRNKHLQGTIRKIEAAGGAVLYKKFHTGLTEPEALEREKDLIAFYGKRLDGKGPLVNLSDGGQGTSGYTHTDETKAKISARSKGNTHMRGRKLTPEQCKRISEAHKGLPGNMLGKSHTEETKRKIREKRALQPPTFVNRSHTEETKRKISNSNKGKTAWNKGREEDPEKIKAMNDKWRGSKQTPEAIEKIRQASIAMWARRRENAARAKEAGCQLT